MFRSLYASKAPPTRRPALRSIGARFEVGEVRERASRALSIPVALRVTAEVSVVGVSGESSWDRSRLAPLLLVFLPADLALAFFGVVRCDFSSSARRAAFSALRRASAAFFSASASLYPVVRGRILKLGGGLALLLRVGFGAFIPFFVLSCGSLDVCCSLLLRCSLGFLFRHYCRSVGCNSKCSAGRSM